MKYKVALAFFLLAAIAFCTAESSENTVVSDDDLQYVIKAYKEIRKYPLYVFDADAERLLEIENAAKAMDFENYIPKTAQERAWYLFYKDFAEGRSYLHILSFSDYKIEVCRIEEKIYVYFRVVNEKSAGSNITCCFDKDGNVLEIDWGQ